MQASPHALAAPVLAGEILGKLGMELAFVEPGQDTGLLPINSLLMDLEELIQAGAPPAIRTALATARGWLDAILDGAGKFTRQSIEDLNAWHAWLSPALSAWERGTDVPNLPSAWTSTGPAATTPAGASPPVNPASAPVATPSNKPTPAEPGPATALAPAPSDVRPGDEPVIRLTLAEDSELLTEFHAESLELLQLIEQGVLVLEQQPKDAATLNAIFRAFHTFKGGAGFLHLDAMRDLAHDLESLLDAARRSELEVNSAIIDLILAGADALKQFTREIGGQLQGVNAGQPIIVPSRALRQRVRAALGGGPLPPAIPAPAGPGNGDIPAARSNRDQEPAAPSPREPVATGSGSSAQHSDPARSEATAKTEAAAGFVKLDTRKLDSLVDLVGELVIAQSMVVQDPDVQRSPSRHLARCLRQLGRITTELQRTAMSLRMVPIRPSFQKLTRLVRDLAAQQQKQVQLLVEGEETELDRNIVEQLSDPLVHMIRNAVDHGIEPPASRVAKGKPALGTIRLSAAHQRGGIVISIQDDGSGLDRDRLLAKARERGLIQPDATLSEAECFALIFAPGFSTAEKVTDVSGRGVGMDVVRRNIEKLRGRVEIQSVAGAGTTFTILLPLTLAIIDGMLVGVGDDRYIIPTLSVRESFRPRPGMVTTVHERGEVVSVRGRLTPLLRLGQHLGTPGRAVDPTEGIIVVVESGEAARGLLVDELLGKQEVVIKNLGETFRKQNLLAGAAILGDGRVGLILDVDTLVKCQTDQNQPAFSASH
jgi:two-component system chemotaxis sensor kinase CheA